MKLICSALLLAVAQASPSTAVVRDLGNYPGYAGDVKAKGTAFLTWSEPRGVQIDFKITGVEAECSEPSDAGNSCGIHIHAGRSCENATAPGGHYYNTTSDPWGQIRYVAKGGVAVGSVSLSYGYDYESTIGRALVVHDRSGARVTCALLVDPNPVTVRVKNLGSYPGYAGNLSITGNADFIFYGGDSVNINFNMRGVESECSQPSDAGNSCGIHIHAGTSCDDASQPGPHYFNKNTVASDPWSPTVYQSRGGFANGVVRVKFGYGYDTTKGRVLVVHDRSGARVTCIPIPTDSRPELALLAGPAPANPNNPGTVRVKNLGSYPGYAGNLSITGYADFLFYGGDYVNINFDLKGVEFKCSQPSDAGNSCGIHIHAGFSCDDASQPGPHYFNKDTVASDPWSPTVYQSRGGSANGAVTVKFGYGVNETRGRVLVVHDRSGARVTCAPILY